MDNPQDLINQALGGNTPTTKAEPATPTLPTPEPISPATTAESPTETTSAASETPTTSVQPVATQQQPAPAMDAVVPTELTNDNGTMTTATAVPDATATEQPVMPEISNVEAKGEDVPLALVGAAPIAADTAATIPTPTVEPVANAVVQPVITPTPSSTDNVIPKKKHGKIIGLMIGILAMFGVLGFGGYWLYITQYSEAVVIAGVFTDNADKDSCEGCHNGGWLVWRNGQCKVTGICGNEEKPDKNTENPNTETTLNNEVSCEGANKGYVWCSSVDSNNKPYAFCNTTGKGCNQAAIDKGYSIRIGVLKCIQSGDSWVLDKDYYNSNTGAGAQTADEVLAAYKATTGKNVDPCSVTYSTTSGKEQYICKEGVVGQGTATQPGVPYTGGACTALNGKKFTGNINCFCGTVQVDTANGHESYSSTCGCDKANETENNPSPSPSGSVSFMCTSIRRTAQANPATGLISPAMGDKLTFTCEGAATPAGSVSLTYKFRYNINDGAYTALTNKTATTAEMTIAQCGRYKVQCQACGTINGVLSCDPVWTPATKQ